MKGIILAGGSGTRLYPITVSVSKQMLPVFDKPMIYYPLATLMSADIRDILIITTPSDSELFKKNLGDGSGLGIRITYDVQPRPDGLAQALIIGEKFLDGEPCALILGDNIFIGKDIAEKITKASDDAKSGNATIFVRTVPDPKRFGIVEFDENGKAVSIEEKPSNPKSNYCVTGLYFYDGNASEYAKTLKPSKRGELEITDLNNIYLSKSNLKVEKMDPDDLWLDAGTFDSLAEASLIVQRMTHEKGKAINSPEEISFRKGWISKSDLLKKSDQYAHSEYGRYLRKLAEM